MVRVETQRCVFEVDYNPNTCAHDSHSEWLPPDSPGSAPIVSLLSTISIWNRRLQLEPLAETFPIGDFYTQK
jgi:hypothetical protein